MEPTGLNELVQSAITAVSILGGAMAYTSGYNAARALAEEDPPEVAGQSINEGLGRGFAVGFPLAFVVSIIEAWT
jgi:hypothetical protein